MFIFYAAGDQKDIENRCQQVCYGYLLLMLDVLSIVFISCLTCSYNRCCSWDPQLKKKLEKKRACSLIYWKRVARLSQAVRFKVCLELYTHFLKHLNYNWSPRHFLENIFWWALFWCKVDRASNCIRVDNIVRATEMAMKFGILPGKPFYFYKFVWSILLGWWITFFVYYGIFGGGGVALINVSKKLDKLHATCNRWYQVWSSAFKEFS